MNYDIAIKAKTVKLEARYAIRIPGPESKHKNVTEVSGTALFEGLIMATILNISAGNDAPIRWFEPKAANAEFGTPVGATAAFAPMADGWQGYKKCMMVGIQKDGAAAYAFFLFDDLAAVDPELREPSGLMWIAGKKSPRPTNLRRQCFVQLQMVDEAIWTDFLEDFEPCAGLLGRERRAMAVVGASLGFVEPPLLGRRSLLSLLRTGNGREIRCRERGDTSW